MKYSEVELLNLRNAVSGRLSQKRFLHTLGVERAAIDISNFFEFLDQSELRAAALLHDIAKELRADEQKDLIKRSEICFTEHDYSSDSILHSFAAAPLILEEFSEFATENILSAVRNHTTGDKNMSLFDEVIFISDYIEDGRTYEECKNVRKMLFDSLYASKSKTETHLSLHSAVLASIKNTKKSVLMCGRILNERTLETEKYIIGLIKKYGEKDERN